MDILAELLVSYVLTFARRYHASSARPPLPATTSREWKARAGSFSASGARGRVGRHARDGAVGKSASTEAFAGGLRNTRTVAILCAQNSASSSDACT